MKNETGRSTDSTRTQEKQMKEFDKKDVVVNDVDGNAVDALSADLADVVANQTDSVEEIQLSLSKKEKELDDSKQADAKESVDVAAADSGLAAMIMAESVDAPSAGQGGGAASADGGLSSNGKLLAAAGVVTAAGIAVAASDGDGGGSGGNKAPEANPSRTVSTTEGEAVTFTVQATDPNDDALTFTATAPGNGTVSISGGQVTYTPEAGFDGSDEFIITISDGKKSVNQTISVNVADGNDAPVVDPTQTVNVDEDGSVIFSVAATDPQGDSFTYSVSQLAASGTVSPTGNFGEFAYTPDGDFNGSDTVVISVTDSAGNVSTQTVTLNVASINDDPTVTTGPTATATTRGEAVTGSVEAQDVEGDVTYSLLAQPANGAVTLDAATGDYTYTPNSSTFTGSDAFTIVATDADGATVNIAVPMVVGAEAIDKFNAELDANNPEMINITGDRDVRIDVTGGPNGGGHITGLDKNGNGTIDNDGIENNISDQESGFTIVNAYPGDVLNEGNDVDNYTGDLEFDGTGFGGDGVSSDGNIVLGGMGMNTIFTGIGNDFVGLANLQNGADISLGRNADFFHLTLSDISDVSGDNVDIDAGHTFDDDESQDSDWLFLDVQDDEDGVVVTLGDFGSINDGINGLGFGFIDTQDFENFSASGWLAGFLDGIDVTLGEGAASTTGTNFTLGSTAQLDIFGSNDRNIIIGGYDNDEINGDGGNDILFGGDMQFLTANQNNPNILEIPNDGRDELRGGGGDDMIMFEQDGGVIEGDGGSDTLFATDFTSGSKDGDLTSDGVIRIDLGAQTAGPDGKPAFAGYGGDDQDITADQTNYADEANRVDITEMESVITTGLGGFDFDVDGGNNAEKSFDQMANYHGLNQDVDLRGTDGDNVLYANIGTDIVEGRGGDDSLSGGDKNDLFLFDLNSGDDIDVIHRQTDADNDGLWDVDADGNVLYERDFLIGDTTSGTPSSLNLSVSEVGNPGGQLANISVGLIKSVIYDTAGDIAFTLSSNAISAANTYAELLVAIQAEIAANPDIAGALEASLDNGVIRLVDSAGRTLEDSAPDALFSVSGNNVSIDVDMNFGAPVQTVSEDELHFVAYEDRNDNERVDDDAEFGGDSLGGDAYAQDLVVKFDRVDPDTGVASTVLAEDQLFRVNLGNLAVQDKVTITVNGVKYTLEVGKDLDGSLIANETTDQFAFRMADYIDNNVLDDDLASGDVGAANVATFNPELGIIELSQNAYANEETVFMEVSVDVDDNSSNGQVAVAEVDNLSDSDITLYDFDGRNGELNKDSVKFIGDTGTSRAVLETATDAGGDLFGSDAIVVNVTGGLDIDGSAAEGINGADIYFDEIENPTTGNAANYSVHGHDQLFGGEGNDKIVGGTGDDRFYVSAGLDDIDGGADLYLVDGQLRVLNAAEAAKLDAQQNIQSVTPIAMGMFSDTLIADQSNFGNGTVGSGGATFNIALDLSSNQLDGGSGRIISNNQAGNTTWYKDVENVRTVAGDGTLAGQGNDTLDLSVSVNYGSKTSGLNNANMQYSLTRTVTAGEVYLDRNDDDLFTPGELIAKVDGVENVIFGGGDDVLFIDETEAGKNNTVNGGLGDDLVEYSFSVLGNPDFNPGVTLTVNAGGNVNVDHVDMNGGILPFNDTPKDTLTSVEMIGFNSNNNTLVNPDIDDVLDVTNVVDAVVDFVNNEVRNGSGGTEVEITSGMHDFEVVNADYSDTVIVADAMNNSRTSAVVQDVQFNNYLNFRLLDATNTDRQDIGELRASNSPLPQAENIALYTFNMGPDSDTVDYSNETGLVMGVVNFDSATEASVENVFVSDDGDMDFGDNGNRIDALTGNENLVASQGNSVIDLTQATGEVVLAFNADNGPTSTDAALDRDVYRIQLTDGGSTNAITGINFLEYFDAGNSGTVTQNTAAWNTVYGGDANNKVTLTDHESTQVHNIHLAGGENTIEYGKLTRSIALELDFTNLDFDDTTQATALNSGLITGTVDFTDGNFNSPLPGGVTDNLSAHSYNNGIARGENLVIEGSLDGEDVFSVVDNDGSTYYVGEVVSGSDRTRVTNGDDNIILTGFEFLQDSSSDDTYVVNDLSDFLEKTALLDNINPDVDTLQLTDDALDNFTSTKGALTNVNWSDDTIELDQIELAIDDENGVIGGAFSYERLDISKLTQQTDAVITLDAGESVVLGDLGLFGDQGDANIDVQGFETIEFTSIAGMGQDVVVDMDLGEFRTAGGTVLFTFDSADSFDFSAIPEAMTVTVVDDPTVANFGSGNLVDGVTIIGDAEDTFTGAAGDDVLIGGPDADTLDGGFVPEQVEVHTYTLTADATATAGGTLIIDGVTITEGLATQGVVVAEDDADAYGAAFVREWDANPAAFTNNADIESVTYDALTNALTFTFTSAAGDVADALLGAPAGTIAAAGGAETVTTAFAAQVDSADTFVYTDASDSQVGGMDTILNWDSSDLIDVDATAIGTNDGIQDALNPANYAEVGGVADFAAAELLADAAFAALDSFFVADDGTDSWVFIDVDQNGVYEAANDMVIMAADTLVADFSDLNFVG